MSDLPADLSADDFGEQPTVEAAIRRLIAALNALETVAERRQENDHGQDNLSRRIQEMGADRARLAHELDGSLARSRTLEAANRNIAERLDGAIEAIRGVLKSGEQG